MFRPRRVALFPLKTAEELYGENQRLSTRLDELECLRATDLQIIAGLEEELRVLRVCNTALDADAEKRAREVGILMTRNAALEYQYAQALASMSALNERSALGTVELKSCRRLLAQREEEMDAVIRSQLARLTFIEEKLVQMEVSCAFHAKQWAALEEVLLSPIGLGIMRSPVIVSTGHCYEQTEIADWLDRHTGNEICPITKERLTMVGPGFVRTVFVLRDVCQIVSQTLRSVKDSRGLTHVETTVV